MDPLIELLRNNSNRTPKEIALAMGISETDVVAQIAAAEADGTILGYSAVVDRLKAGDRRVTALIEVRISPERDGGFDRLARRISKFDQVRDCYLMSGGYDLAVIVEGKDLLDVATFVAEKLSTLGGVLSTATRFQLKAYKENGFLSNDGGDEERLLVAP
jgi:DNA-binding Lrp family transcriptional regulator